jgi:hypothetical protein
VEEELSQPWYPGPAIHGSRQIQRWEPGKLLSELREKKACFTGSSEAIEGVYHSYVDFSGFPHCLLLQLSVRVIILALMFLRNAGPYSSLETVLNTLSRLFTPQAIRASKAEPPPSPPLVCTPPPGKMQIGTSLGGSLTSASNSRSKVILLAVGGCGDHFLLHYKSVQSQTAEILTREYRRCASPHGRVTGTQAGLAQLGHAQGEPVRDGF